MQEREFGGLGGEGEQAHREGSDGAWKVRSETVFSCHVKHEVEEAPSPVFPKDWMGPLLPLGVFR